MKRRTFLKASIASLGTTLLIPGISHGTHTHKKIGVFCGSRYGSTKDASAWIALGMGGAGHIIDFKQDPDLSAFDYFVIGSGIYFGEIDTSLKRYIQHQVKHLKNKIIGLFVVCGGGFKGAAERGYLTQFIKLCPTGSPLTAAFSGHMNIDILNNKDKKDLEHLFHEMGKPFVGFEKLPRDECFQFGRRVVKNI